MEFDPFGVSVKDLCTQNVITRCNISGPLYTLRLSTCLALPSTPPMVLVASVSTWYCHLRHLGSDTLYKLSNAFVINTRMSFAMPASLGVTLAYLLLVLCREQSVILM
jgi:hypothetical protein